MKQQKLAIGRRWTSGHWVSKLEQISVALQAGEYKTRMAQLLPRVLASISFDSLLRSLTPCRSFG